MHIFFIEPHHLPAFRTLLSSLFQICTCRGGEAQSGAEARGVHALFGGPERGTGPPSPGRLRLRARGAPLARPQPFCCPSAARAVVVCWQMVFVVLGCGAAVRHSGELSVPALSGSAEVSSRCLQATGPTRASCSRPVSLLAHCFTEVRIENAHL